MGDGTWAQSPTRERMLAESSLGSPSQLENISHRRHCSLSRSASQRTKTTRNRETNFHCRWLHTSHSNLQMLV